MKKACLILLKINMIQSFIIGGFLLVYAIAGHDARVYDASIFLFIFGAFYIASAILSIVARNNIKKGLVIALLVISALGINVLPIVACSLLLKNVVGNDEDLVLETKDENVIEDVEEKPVEEVMDLPIENTIDLETIENEEKVIDKRPSRSYFITNVILSIGIYLFVGFVFMIITVVEFSYSSPTEDFSNFISVFWTSYLAYLLILVSNIVVSFKTMNNYNKNLYIACIVLSSFCFGIFGIIGSAIGAYHISKEENNLTN